MRKFLSVILTLMLIFPLASIAGQSESSKKISHEKVHKLKTNKKQKITKKRKVRVAHHINKPKEGEMLKIEAMVKDINEQ